jgi:hypothetical protein
MEFLSFIAKAGASKMKIKSRRATGDCSTVEMAVTTIGSFAGVLGCEPMIKM